ncbi:MAG: endonuclease/exonuclease/phosphatase family protein [Chloroflexota bacterium]|nr:endonuclease/exonuclease/phosphatase family protein [Chloroflexota bacterium]
MLRVTVLSLNIWNYRGGWAARRGRIARLIGEIGPDVVGLQEVRRDPRYAFGMDQAAQLARLTGLQHVYAPAMRYWRWPRVEEGLAVLTPHPILRHAIVPLCWNRTDRRDPNRRIALHATIAMPGDVPLDCWVAHLNQRPPLRDASAAILYDAVYVTPSPLLMGDFNAEPDSVTVQIFSVSGLWDMWQSTHPDDSGFTYPAEAPTGRIDYLFAGSGWRVERMERVGVGSHALSDHCGLCATLVFEAGPSQEM